MILGLLLSLGASALLLGALVGRAAPRLWLATTLLGTGAGLLAAGAVLSGGDPWRWSSPFSVGGQALHLELDAISALFLALACVLGGLGAVYGRQYWTDSLHPRSAPAGRTWWNAMVLCMGLVLLSANGLHFLMAWELFTLAVYCSITLDRQRTEVRAAGWLYLAASHAASLCLFGFFAALAASTRSWELGPMRERVELAPLFWLALLGFGIKAGLFPLHVWLPVAHANAPSHVSALMSGVTIKMGIYGLVRFGGWMPVPEAAGWVLVVLGVLSAVLGVAFALGQHDLKRLLAYHSVENIGIIGIGLGFALLAAPGAWWGRLALAGALLHVWNHGLFKALLFLGAGSVLHATGTREMSRLGGLWRRMPWTAGLFGLGAAAIAGLPPLNGFVSEWLVFLGLLDAVSAHGDAAPWAVAAAVLLAVTGALAVACFAKVCGIVFLGASRSEAAAHAHESGRSMRGAMLVLGCACITIGVAPALVWPAVARAAGAWQATWGSTAVPAPLIALGVVHPAIALLAVGGTWLLWRRARRFTLVRGPTWACGYAKPTARMQYTASSFAALLTDWFSFVLRPRRHEDAPVGAFPVHASHAQHTPETVLEHVVEPVGRGFLRLSQLARRLQHGSVQSYLLYLLIGVIVLGVVVSVGGEQ